MKSLAAGALLGGSFVAVNTINPALNECLPVMVDEEYTDPTVMNPDGVLVAVAWVIECGAEGGDDMFSFRVEADDEEFGPAVQASATVVTYVPGGPGAP